MLFPAKQAWAVWLKENHRTNPGLWLRIAKKGSTLQSVSYQEALDVALCYGWIDGQKKPENEETWLQRFLPRTNRSLWPKVNREKVQALIASGEMQPAGLEAIANAKKNGRWEAACDSSSTSTVPIDLQQALDANPKAAAFFETLNRANRYAILWRIQTVKKAETRARKIVQFIAMLERHEKIHPLAVSRGCRRRSWCNESMCNESMLLPRLALVLCLACSAIAQTPVTIDATAAASSTRIPPRFLGLSFETSSLTSTTGFPAENPVFQKMVSQLGPGVLRLGGNSDDQTLWAPGPRVSSDPKTILRTTDVDRLFSFAAAIGWNVLWSVNLGTGTPDQAADEAGYVQTTYAPLLLGFEIGNEPDLYYKNGLRTSTYTENNYFTEWKAFADAIQLKAPAAVLTGSAASGSYATWTAAFATQYGSRIALLTQHEYVTGPLASVAATASNSATIPHLLGTAIHAAADTEAAGLTQIAKKAGLPWRMAEANSCYNGGQTGVSNAFASALWGVDWMFTLAADGSTGVNFHGGGSGTYTPIAATVSGSTVTMSARPLYYALLLFQAAARGRIVPVNVQAGAVNLTSYAALDDDGSRRVIVINKDAALDAAVRISVGPQYQTASVLRLSAPALDAATGVTLGGSTVQPDGSWSPATTETLAVNAGAASATVPAGSAALFLFSPGNVAVANAAGGQPVVAPESLATAYGEGLAFVQQSATQTPLPTTLAAAQVTIQDANGVTQQAPLLYVSPSQVNFQVPAGAASGPASITLAGSTGTAQIALAAPGLFTLGSTKVAAAQAFRQPNGTATLLPLPASDCTTGTCVTVPLSLDANSTVFVSLYATGLRHATAPVTCTVGGTPVPALYAGAQGTFIGLDQINLSLPVTLRGLGETDVACSANGLTSNAVRINVGG